VDHRSGTVDQHGSQVRVAAFAHTQQRGLAAAGVLARHNAEPSCELAAVVEVPGIANAGYQCRRGQWADARNLLQATTGIAGSVPGLDLRLDLFNLPLQLLEM